MNTANNQAALKLHGWNVGNGDGNCDVNVKREVGKMAQLPWGGYVTKVDIPSRDGVAGLSYMQSYQFIISYPAHKKSKNCA